MNRLPDSVPNGSREENLYEKRSIRKTSELTKQQSPSPSSFWRGYGG